MEMLMFPGTNSSREEFFPGLVLVQLDEVTLKYLSTHVRMDALGLSGLALMQLEEVTWKYSSTHIKMDARGMISWCVGM